MSDKNLDKFKKYLDGLKKHKYKRWELTVLGGFGGYKSQVKGKK